jgi:uncharacterized Fe-S cluster protein YjdI
VCAHTNLCTLGPTELVTPKPRLNPFSQIIHYTKNKGQCPHTNMCTLGTP